MVEIDPDTECYFLLMTEYSMYPVSLICITIVIMIFLLQHRNNKLCGKIALHIIFHVK